MFLNIILTNIKDLIIEIKKLNQRLLYFIKTFILKHKNTSFKELMIKKIIIVFILFYCIFNIFFPNGFLINSIKKYNENTQLQSQFKQIKYKLFCTDGTINSLKNNDVDTLEEILINNCNKKIKNRKFILIY